MEIKAFEAKFESITDFGRATTTVTGSGKVDIVKNSVNHACKAIYSPIAGNISIKAEDDTESEYRTYPVVAGLNTFGVIFNKVDIDASLSLTNVIFIL